MIGFGFDPEGIENNEVIYELLADMGWRKKPIDLNKWLKVYCMARYGGYPQQMAMAWRELRQSVYGRFTGEPRFIWQMAYPDPERNGTVVTSDSIFTLAVKHFLACSKQLKQSKLYRNDALLLTGMYLGAQADKYYKKALEDKVSGYPNRKKAAEAKVIQLLKAVDRLMASEPNDRLSRWVKKARLWGKTPAEKDYYEEDAKRLITTWGGSVGDYAAKMWSGLIRNYYLPRVKMVLAGQSKQEIKAWEEHWVEKPGPVNKTTPYNHPVAKAKQLVAKFSN